MPNAALGGLMPQSPCQRIVISNELASFLREGRIETRLHIVPHRPTRIAFMIKPRKVIVPDTLPARAVFVPSGAFSGWFEVIEQRPNTFAIVDDAHHKSYPLYPCSSGNPQCSAIFFSAASCCDTCASSFCPVHIMHHH